MIRTATEQDLASIRALIKSVPAFWHDEWRSDVLERALRASDGLAFVWEEEGNILGFKFHISRISGMPKVCQTR